MNEQEFDRRWSNRSERYIGSPTIPEDLSNPYSC